MKRFLVALGMIFLLATTASAGGLVTGERMGFVPGDKVLFKTDFRKCPVGDLPEGFDLMQGSGECVKYDNHIWFSSITWVRLYKSASLGDDEFSVEFDLLFLKGNCRPVEFSFYSGTKPGQGGMPYKVTVGPGCTGEAVYVGIEGMGGVYKSPFKSLNKQLHVAVQVRRRQFRLFLNGKRLVIVPFNVKKKITSVGFALYGKYGQLISNITIAKYSTHETKPTPEKLGIEVRKTKTATCLIIPEKVLFDFNKFFLKPQARQALHLVAGILKDHPHKKIYIVGYTDNVGSDEYNLRLSLQRAQSVADFLIYVEGIPSERIKIEGKGKANPVADNSTEQGRAANRRVEIKLVD